MVRAAFVDDEDYPLAEWVAEQDMCADGNCPLCAGDGVDAHGQPCGCLVAALLARFTEAAEDATPVADCARCDGDGEDLAGQLCPCLLPALRAAQDLLADEAQEID